MSKKGRLHTRDSHAHLLREAEDCVMNFNAQLIPSPSSPDYSLTMRDHKGNVNVRCRTSSRQNLVRSNSPSRLLAPSIAGESAEEFQANRDKSLQRQVLNRYIDGAADFWIDVPSSVPPVLPATLSGNSSPRFPAKTHCGLNVSPDSIYRAPKHSDELAEKLFMVQRPSTLAEDKAKNVADIFIQGVGNGQVNGNTSIITPEELTSVKVYTESDNIPALRKSKKKFKKKTVVEHQDERLVLDSKHIKSYQTLPPTVQNSKSNYQLRNVCAPQSSSNETSLQIIRSIAGDQYGIPSIESTSTSSESHFSFPLSMGDGSELSAVSGLPFLEGQSRSIGGSASMKGVVLEASVAPITSRTQSNQSQGATQAAAMKIDSAEQTTAPLVISNALAIRLITPRPSPCVPIEAVSDYLIGEEDWEREAEQELRRAYSLSALPPSVNIPQRSHFVDFNMSLTTNMIGNNRNGRLMNKARKTSRPAMLTPLGFNPVVQHQGPLVLDSKAYLPKEMQLQTQPTTKRKVLQPLPK